ncbi:hypothetical protein UT300019_23030 [Clostridium sp. CTA-19]
MNNYNWKDAFPSTPKSFKSKINTTLNSLCDEEEIDEMKVKTLYKKPSFKRRTVVALAAAMIIGTTVFAGGKIFSITSHGSNIPTYTTMPTEEKIQNDLGFNPKLVNEFSNGYTFKNGYTKTDEGLDIKGNSVAKSKSLDFDYEKDNNKLSLSMQNVILGKALDDKTAVDNYNNINIYYNSYTNKFVPEDYKMTEQDKQDEKSGKYVFSYGSDKEEISEVQYLEWKQDGIYYSFLAMDCDISQDELVEMAHEIIDAK